MVYKILAEQWLAKVFCRGRLSAFAPQWRANPVVRLSVCRHNGKLLLLLGWISGLAKAVA
jgi:hypothetical protein